MKKETKGPAAMPDGTVQRGRGHLTVFFSYADGAGKARAMAEAALVRQRAGEDVVVGWANAHTSATAALLQQLETLPPLQVEWENTTLPGFDLDAALRRRPALVLLESLAHTNLPGQRHVKRSQDAEELLRAGIDVYTTLNVHHLESLNDIVASITGAVETERLADHIFDEADQVFFIDQEPALLGQQGQDGFDPASLQALRELALRRVADRLSRFTAPPAQTGEHILICLSSAPSNATVIRAAARLVEAFHGAFTALYVEPTDSARLDGESLQRLRANHRLAEELGARTATVYGDDVPAQIAEYARTAGVTKIVVGRSGTTGLGGVPGRNIVDQLTRLAPNIDIYIIPDSQPLYQPKKTPMWRPIHVSLGELGKVLVSVTGATALGQVFYTVGLGEGNIITAYILGVLLASMWANGRLYGALASVVSVVVFNLFFTEPRFTLHAYDASYPITFLVMLLASFIVSSLTAQVRRQAQESARKASRTQLLLETSQKLQKAEDTAEILALTAGQLRQLLGRTVVFYPAEGAGLGEPRVFPAEDDAPAAHLTVQEREAALWVYHNNKHAGALTGTLPAARFQYLAVRGQNQVYAVAGVAMAGRQPPDAYAKNLMLAILDECGLILEKKALNREKGEAEVKAQREALRANLLRAISHDLRTPLTGIMGSAGVLMENSSLLEEGKKQALYTDIYDDAVWLVNLVENLLSVTRIEDGLVPLRQEAELLDDIFREALTHVDRRIDQHHVEVALEDDMLMAQMDAQLVMQVVVNIVNNAIKYTPAGSTIKLTAQHRGDMVAVTIADNGPGIPESAQAQVFDMFYTLNQNGGDSRRGIGLGLSLCRTIVTAHGGEIHVEDNPPHGAAFVFTLPAAELPAPQAGTAPF